MYWCLRNAFKSVIGKYSSTLKELAGELEGASRSPTPTPPVLQPEVCEVSEEKFVIKLTWLFIMGTLAQVEPASEEQPQGEEEEQEAAHAEEEAGEEETEEVVEQEQQQEEVQEEEEEKYIPRLLDAAGIIIILKYWNEERG